MGSLEVLFGDDATVLRDTDFQLLLLANVLPIFGTALLSPVLDSLIDPFGTTAADIGLMVSFFTAPGIVMIPVAGVLADRHGRKPILVGSLVVFGLAGAAIPLTTDFRVVLALRLVQGIGFAGISPVIITSVGDLYSGAREATAQGLRFTGSGLSGTVFPLVSGFLVVVGWRYPFLLYTIAIPVAAAVYLWFEEPTVGDDPATTDGGEERASAGAGDDPTAPDDGETYAGALFALLRRPRVLSLVVARALPTVVWIGFVTYNSLIVVRLMGGTPPQAGLLVAVGSLVFALAGSQAGRITAWFDSRFVPLVAANACLGAGFVVVLFAPGIPVAAAGIAVAGVGFGITLSLYRSIITGLAPPSLRAGLVSLAEAGGRVTNTVVPIAMGAVIALATPTLGFAGAVQLAGLGAAVVGAGGGIVCLVVAKASPPVPAETAA